MELSLARHLWAASTVVFLAALSGTAEAQQPLRQHSEAVTDDGFDGDTTSWNISAGGVLNTGNTESLQLSTGTTFQIVRGSHGFEAEAQFVLGLAGDNFDTETANNLRARGRYDFFFTPMDALFAALAVRQDRFAGLSPRVQGQVGYLRNFLKNEDGAHRFWGEIGYDITYDNFDYDLLDTETTDPATLPDDQIVHAARVFLGYDNHLNENLTYKTGLEGLFNVEELDDFRLNWDNALRTSIGGNLQAELKFSLQLDTEPVVGAKRIDTATTLNLIYTLLDESEGE